jgi:hypothetical protein
MKKFSILIIIVAIVVLLVNIPPVKQIIGSDDCRYSNDNGSFTFQETNFGGYDYHLCMNRWKLYKIKYKADTILYRLTPMHPLSFWNYGDYLFQEKYRIPFKSWETIKNRRGPITGPSGVQDF